MLITNNLNIGYGRKCIQKNLNLQANDGDLICLIGKNGTGKSTLLRTLAGLQKPLSGTIRVQNQDINALNSSQRATLLSLVLTDTLDVDKLTLYNLVAMGRIPYTNWAGRLSAHDRKIVETALQQVNLEHKANCYIDEISDGEKQRGIIAKALAQDTPLVLFDEPTAHLDLPCRIDIMQLLRRLSAETRKMFILSTHELDLAQQMANHIWLMTSNGIETGLPEDLMLKGKFSEAFGNTTFHFDNNGHYQIEPPLCNKHVCVVGDTPAAMWMRHACHRSGLICDANAPTTITCTETSFVVENEIFTTISDTLNWVLNTP